MNVNILINNINSFSDHEVPIHYLLNAINAINTIQNKLYLLRETQNNVETLITNRAPTNLQINYQY